jgi:hypothetical protein
MALTYFPVTAILKAIVSDTSADPDGTPNTQFISCFVNFTPSVNQVYSTTDHTMYKLAPIRARTNPDDGVLKNIDGTPVSLVANTTELDIDELTYKVTFSNVVYGEAEQTIQPFSFVAPTTNTTVDLTTVARL